MGGWVGMRMVYVRAFCYGTISGNQFVIISIKALLHVVIEPSIP